VIGVSIFNGLKKNSYNEKPAIPPSMQLFLMSLPFLILIFLFAYLPLAGWTYAFFEYRAGLNLFDCDFIGIKYFSALISNPISRMDIFRVLKNTFVMSFLGLITSPLPVIFAVMLSEVKRRRVKGIIQTVTTLPNFISWVLVYAVVWSFFSINDGFVNRLLLTLGLVSDPINFLGTNNNVWMSMLGYQIWKGLGWSAILYLAAIAGIDQELYEAATVDGAGRWRLIWHITIPGILPTFFVLLLLSIANFINNGMEQYFIFQNPMNKEFIEVLDLYVYNRGIRGNNIPSATAVGMLKSVVSIALLFIANKASKRVRGETIV